MGDRRLPLRRIWPWLLGALLLHVLPFATRPALIGGDEPHFALMAHSIATDHDLDLTDDYLEVRQGSAAAGAKRRGNVLDPHVVPHGDRMVFAHPLGLPVLAVPLLWILETVSPGAPPDLVLGLFSLAVTFAALVAGWRLLADFLEDVRDAAWMAFALYFSTPLWYYSRTFFTEPFVWSFGVLALFAMARRRWLAASVLLAVTCLIKEVAILIVAPILAFAAHRLGWRRAWALAAGPGVAVVITLIRNQVFYGRVFDTYQPFELGPFWRSAVGILFDLGHGLFPFAPVLLIAALGWGVRRRKIAAVDGLPYAGAMVVAYLVLTSLWMGALGGDCYGPRLLVPIIPAFALPLACMLELSRKSRALDVLIQAAVVAGFTIQFCAATDPVAAMWSASIPELLSHLPAAVGAALLGSLIVVLIHRRFPAPEPVA